MLHCHHSGPRLFHPHMQTTYDVAIKDESVLRRFRWSAMVLDEGHCLKGGRQGGSALHCGVRS